jgi:succinate dehydrogenase/fumarate reductase flavoprotein subunit
LSLIVTVIGSYTIIPKEYIQTFKNIVYEFLWKGKKDPVKRSVLSNDYLEGGLKMTNIDTHIKALYCAGTYKCYVGQY